MKIIIVLLGIGVGFSSVFLYRIYRQYEEGGLVPEVDRSELRGELDISEQIGREPDSRRPEEEIELMFAGVSHTVVERYSEAFEGLESLDVEVRSVPGGALVIGSPDVVATVAAMLEDETEEVFAVDVSLVQVVTAEEYRDGVQFVVDTIEGLLGDGLKVDAAGGTVRIMEAMSRRRWS